MFALSERLRWLALSAIVVCESPDSKSVLQFGIIGASGYAGVLLDTLQPFVVSGSVKIAAAVVRTSAKIPERYDALRAAGYRMYGSWEAMMEAEAGALDLLIIPTGIQAHRPMAEKALALGHRIFLEKPIAATIEDALAVAEADRASGGGRAVLGYQDLARPSAWWVREQIQSGAIGELRAVRGYGLWPRGDDYYTRNSWAGCLKADGAWVLDSPLNNAFAHFLNLMFFWAAPEGQSSYDLCRVEAELYRARPIESFDTASLRMHSHGGPLIEFHATHSCSKQEDPFIRIEGSRGRIDWAHGRYCELRSGNQVEKIAMENNMEVRRACNEQTIRGIRCEDARVCTIAQGLSHTLCINALHRPGIPIRELRGERIGHPETGSVPVIEGIEDAFRAAFDRGGLLSENGVAWAASPESVEIPEEWRRPVIRESSKEYRETV
ncbi:MAG: Gfo/Idh/MocA family oxidoreductase [Verrucomicrobia bacterium]|jgi:predicted dehydrogenase|nr:Gfo/Idh/MocA family oxidoreductase [Verrucomicrobiota bacterium]